jgi:hypothetical protein
LILHKQFEEREFPAGEVNAFAIDFDSPGEKIEPDAMMLEDRGFLPPLPPEERTKAGDQFFQAKWFGEVIVGSEIQAADPVLEGVSRAENKDRLVKASGPPFPQQVEAVAVRQPKIQNNGVVGALRQRILGRFASSHPSPRIGHLGEASFDEGADLSIVFDN